MKPKNHIEKSMERRVQHYFTWAFKIFFMVIMAILFALLVGYVVMWLWNWLMPDLFGFTTIAYWQAVGLLFLAKIFFGFGTSGPSKGGKSKRTPDGYRSKKCGSLRRDFSNWELYDQFWKEEGEEAYTAYVERKTKDELKDGGLT